MSVLIRPCGNPYANVIEIGEDFGFLRYLSKLDKPVAKVRHTVVANGSYIIECGFPVYFSEYSLQESLRSLLVHMNAPYRKVDYCAVRDDHWMPIALKTSKGIFGLKLGDKKFTAVPQELVVEQPLSYNCTDRVRYRWFDCLAYYTEALNLILPTQEESGMIYYGDYVYLGDAGRWEKYTKRPTHCEEFSSRNLPPIFIEKRKVSMTYGQLMKMLQTIPGHELKDKPVPVEMPVVTNDIPVFYRHKNKLYAHLGRYGGWGEAAGLSASEYREGFNCLIDSYKTFNSYFIASLLEHTINNL